jgi:hypothetical protein
MQVYGDHILDFAVGARVVLFAKVLAIDSSLIDNDELVKPRVMPMRIYLSFDRFDRIMNARSPTLTLSQCTTVPVLNEVSIICITGGAISLEPGERPERMRLDLAECKLGQRAASKA